MGRVEHAGGDLAPIERLAHRREPARAVTHVDVDDTGLAAHQPAHVRVGRDAEQLVERRLARAVIAHRHFSDAEDEIDEHEIAANASGRGNGGNVIAAGEAVRGEAFRDQPSGDGDELRRGSDDVVGAQHADGGRDAAQGEAAQGNGRHTRVRARFSSAPGQVHVGVDESRNHATAGQIVLRDAERFVERGHVPAGPHHRLSGNHEVTAALRLGIVELGVDEELEHRGRRQAQLSLKPPTAAVSRSAASARWPAEEEISSVDALSCSAAAAISSAAAA